MSEGNTHHCLSKCCVFVTTILLEFYVQGFADEDVFVCESRYSGKSKSFKKIKVLTSVCFTVYYSLQFCIRVFCFEQKCI